MTALEVLQKYFGFTAFRPLQAKIIQAILSSQDTLALLPTGGGKSLCYQIPGLVFFQTGGLTLVISPLIALMKDQVDHLVQKNIPATFINHTLTAEEITTRYAGIRDQKYAFVYVSPERLATPKFIVLAKSVLINLVAVDEAHCISQWGHDFRPEYLEIQKFIRLLPIKPIVAAFTATAPPIVKKEIISSLQLVRPSIFQDTFFRSNLDFHVIPCPTSAQQELYLLRLVKKHLHQSGIIYCATRAKSEMVAQLLNHFQISCGSYHGGMDVVERAKVQDAFLQNHLHLIAATNAFGMGVDKPDISFVIHFNFPADLEAYYQEAGRAGRDGSPAQCYLLFYEADVEPQLSLISDQLSQPQQLKIAYQKLRVMAEYLTIKSCRMQFLLKYLGEKNVQRSCHNCDTCQVKTKKAPQRSLVDTKLQKIHRQLKKKKLFYPGLTQQLAQYITLSRPQTKAEYERLPGVGKGWIEDHYALFAVELMENILRPTPHL